MKRNRIMALAGAAVLTLGVAGAALAQDLLAGQAGTTLGSYTQDCTDFNDLDLTIGAGQIGVHFVQTSPDADSGLLDAVFSTDSVSGAASIHHGNSTTLHWYVVITGDLDTTVTSASTNVGGDGNLVISHVCLGEVSSSSTTSFESSEESSTTSVESSTTSFESSEESTTDVQSSSSTTSFSDSQQDTTVQPPTDTIGNTGSGQQSSGLWMLLAALGVLGGSVIVLAPSKAKNKE